MARGLSFFGGASSEVKRLQLSELHPLTNKVTGIAKTARRVSVDVLSASALPPEVVGGAESCHVHENSLVLTGKTEVHAREFPRADPEDGS